MSCRLPASCRGNILNPHISRLSTCCHIGSHCRWLIAMYWRHGCQSVIMWLTIEMQWLYGEASVMYHRTALVLMRIGRRLQLAVFDMLIASFYAGCLCWWSGLRGTMSAVCSTWTSTESIFFINLPKFQQWFEEAVDDGWVLLTGACCSEFAWIVLPFNCSWRWLHNVSIYFSWLSFVNSGYIMVWIVTVLLRKLKPLVYDRFCYITVDI